MCVQGQTLQEEMPLVQETAESDIEDGNALTTLTKSACKRSRYFCAQKMLINTLPHIQPRNLMYGSGCVCRLADPPISNDCCQSSYNTGSRCANSPQSLAP